MAFKINKKPRKIKKVYKSIDRCASKFQKQMKHLGFNVKKTEISKLKKMLKSHAKKELSEKQGRTLDRITDTEFKEFFNQSYQLKCARYADNIDTWSEFLSEGNIFVDFFDDIKSNPERLLLNVFSFLGVEDDQKFISSLAYEKVNSTEASHIPRKYKLYLEELLKPELEKLEKRFGQFGLSSI